MPEGETEKSLSIEWLSVMEGTDYGVAYLFSVVAVMVTIDWI